MSERNTVKEAIKILEGRQAGKDLEYWSEAIEEWVKARIDWLPNFPMHKYRVKPEPLVMYANIYSDGSHSVYFVRETALRDAGDMSLRTAVKLVEATDDE